MKENWNHQAPVMEILKFLQYESSEPGWVVCLKRT